MSFAKVFELYGQHAKSLTLKKEEAIYREEDQANTIYQVLSGTVALKHTSRVGNDIILEIYGADQCFGIIEYIDAAPRLCDAIALECCTIQVLERKSILNLVTSPDPALSAALISEVTQKAKEFAELAVTMTSTNPDERVMRRLYGLACNHPNGVHLSQEKIGHMTGLTRETVNKVLKKLADQGLITVERSHIKFNSISKIRDIIDAY